MESQRIERGKKTKRPNRKIEKWKNNYADSIHAGFESPAADYGEEKIDLNAYVSKYPAATFFARVTGDCMVGSGIFPDDLLVVDRSLTPSSGDIVVGIMDHDLS